ncbi:MAG: T-complex protein 11-domain-containing protein [Linnemannia elongata]|nr:MAG: T-complex protein 11-domain-containing protein [Linnemannia elongata]
MASIHSERASLSPTPQHTQQQQSQQQNVRSAHIEDDSAFESLVESSKALLEALQTWLSANTKRTDTSTPASIKDSTAPTSSTTSAAQEDDTTSLLNFDAAWTSYYNFFEAWKDKDAQRLLKTLLDHAQQIEALWRTVQSDPTARAEWGPRIEEQRRDLRDKARQLAGPDGVARLDDVFADFVSATTPPAPTLPPTTSSATLTTHPAITVTPDIAPEAITPIETDTEVMVPASQPETTEPSSSSSAPVEPTTTTLATKKRQRLVSVSNSDSAMDVDGQPLTGTHVVHPSPATADALLANTDDPTSTGEEPQPKKPFKARVPRQPVTPAGFEKQDKLSNLQLIHELALDPNFKIESKRVGGNSTPSEDTEEGTSSTSSNVNSIESLESRIRAMATKAYFDKIREDAEQGQLGKWIPPLLTTIREQLLDMVPQESSVARQIRDGFDLEFVQQQVDRKVYDVKGALEGILGLMAKLCAPVRDPVIRRIQQDLSLITGNPLQQTPRAAASGNQTASSTPSATPKDLVSVLKDILEMLEEMLMDLANYRLMVARPSLEKQAIPYEQHAFKTALENGETTLDATTAWLETSAASLARASAFSTATSSGSKVQSSSATPSSPSSSSSTKTNRHYEVYINAVLDLLYSKVPLDLSSKEEFPETFVLDQARLTRYQNELQALALIAVMWNISLNVQPPLREEGQQELKQTLFRLMESSETSKETLAEAIIEAKEKTLLLASRPSSSSSTASTRSISSANSPTTSLLLSADQKSYIRNTIERAISFDSSLYSVLSQRIRKVLESYLLSSPPGLGSKPGLMPEQAELNKVGLGAMAKEIETFAAQIGFLIRYNAKVYQPWYDPLLTKILPGTGRKPRTPTAKTAAETPTSAPEEVIATSTTADKAATSESEPAEDDRANESATSPPA